MCGQLSTVENSSVIQPGTLNENIIELIDGSPAEKTEIYTQKAEEAREKLENLLEQNPQSSFLDKIIPSAFAETEVENEVENLLAEIQTYLELATEAATESTDPTEIIELLAEVQTTQDATSELLEDSEIANAEVDDLLEEIAASGDDIAAAVDEVESAVETGISEIEIDIETDVEDFIASGARKINLREKRDPIRRAERKIQSARNEYQKTKIKLVADGVEEVAAEQILIELREQIATAESKMNEGEFAAAGESATEGKRAAKQIKNASEVASRVRVYHENLQVEAEAGDEIAIEKLEKLEPLIDSQKELKVIIEERAELHQNFIEDAKEAREENQKIRRGDREEIRELKQKQINGEIGEEDFATQKSILIEKVEAQKEEAKTVREESKIERENVRDEMREKVETQKEEVKNIREQVRGEEKIIREIENEKKRRSKMLASESGRRCAKVRRKFPKTKFKIWTICSSRK